MNTLIYLWVEPLIMNHERCTDKVYFNCIIKGDYSHLELDEVDELLEGNIMNDIMDLANIDANYNYYPVSAKRTSLPVSISVTHSPEEIIEEKSNKKIKKEIIKIISGKKDIDFTKDNLDITEKGELTLTIPHLKINEKINFPKIWESLEKNFVNKLKKGDKVALTDDNGNTIFEILGGDFLNVGLADLIVKGLKTGDIKGGLFIRDDGSLDIGDYERTFYLKIHTKELLLNSLKLNKSIMDITSQKLLK